METRRNFLHKAAISAAALVTMPSLLRASAGKSSLKKFGFISGIVGKELKADWQGTLRKAAEYGFSEIEIGRHLGNTPSEFLSFCNSVGIQPVAGGVAFTENQNDLPALLQPLLDLKLTYAVVYWPWLTGGPFSLEDCRKSAEILNKMGETCKKYGLHLCWHNHNKEFISMEEGLPFDYLMQHTDPQLVSCEMDIYWVRKGGADPLTMMKRYAGRIKILHVKDMAPGDEMDFACPGDGIINFAPLFREAVNQGIEHYFVERDNVQDGLECLRTSGAFLKNLSF
jgi:sugar phosphate isomerase/epimerase